MSTGRVEEERRGVAQVILFAVSIVKWMTGKEGERSETGPLVRRREERDIGVFLSILRDVFVNHL